MNRQVVPALAALVLAACSPDFDPASRLEKLRVLAIRAEPPEIVPPGVDAAGVHTAALTSLALRADFQASPLRTTTVVHLACVPQPGNPAPTPCVMLANLRDPAVAIADGARQACAEAGDPGAPPWPAIALAGVEACVAGTCGPAVVGGTPLQPAALAIPAALAFPADGPDRVLGVQAVVLAFALDATPDELVRGVGTACPAGDLAGNLARLWAGREHVLATKRVVIRGPAAPDPPNENPAIDGILAGGTVLDAEAATTVFVGTTLLHPQLPADAAARHELYWKLDASGLPIEQVREEWVYSWFSTAGEIDELHAADGEGDEWTIGGTDAGAAALVVAVVRDLRGGTAWQVRRVRVSP